METIRYAARRAVFLAAILLLAAAPVRAADDSAIKEKELINTLKSGAPAEKAIACKQLAIHGSKDAVPALAPLLADPQLASWARIALEAIPDPSASEALRTASEKLEGRLLIGTINSVGVKRDDKAVDVLTNRLKDKDPDVASAAAVALGRIGNAAATKTLRQSLAGSSGAVRSAIAEGCILCAERLLANGKNSDAVAIYDEIRRAELPKQRIIEATRGAILARKSDGIPLLVEQLRSPDKALFQIGLTTAREFSGREVADALAAELKRATPERAALILNVLADREERALPAAVLDVAKTGPKPVRIAAISAIGRLGDASSLSTLLETAADGDAELSQAAKAALADLSGDKVNAEIAARLAKADGKSLAILIELVGQRRIAATEQLVKAVDHADAAVRNAALTALGETVGPKELTVLVTQVVSPKKGVDAAVATRALKAAAVRMPDREAAATELAAAMPRASAATKAGLLEILGTMGGAKSLQTIAGAVKGNDEQLQDVGSRVLGEWMSVDAAPALLDITKTATSEKYKVRALRGYIRLARQFAMSDQERAEMCQNALDAANRAEEQKLVLAVLERYPSVDTLRVAVRAAELRGLKEDATRVAMVIANKIGGNTTDARELLSQIGLSPVKLEILKAEYGSGDNLKDVTKTLQQQVRDLPLIVLPKASYNESFGGDPVPGTAKRLKVQYRVNGKTADATFAENAVIMLPMPK
jgi:HEAT repeat protein